MKAEKMNYLDAKNQGEELLYFQQQCQVESNRLDSLRKDIESFFEKRSEPLPEWAVQVREVLDSNAINYEQKAKGREVEYLFSILG